MVMSQGQAIFDTESLRELFFLDLHLKLLKNELFSLLKRLGFFHCLYVSHTQSSRFFDHFSCFKQNVRKYQRVLPKYFGKFLCFGFGC